MKLTMITFVPVLAVVSAASDSDECSSKYSYEACMKDSNCVWRGTYDMGACFPKPTPTFCTSNRDCPFMYECVGNVCEFDLAPNEGRQLGAGFGDTGGRLGSWWDDAKKKADHALHDVDHAAKQTAHDVENAAKKGADAVKSEAKKVDSDVHHHAKSPLDGPCDTKHGLTIFDCQDGLVCKDKKCVAKPALTTTATTTTSSSDLGGAAPRVPVVIPPGHPANTNAKKPVIHRMSHVGGFCGQRGKVQFMCQPGLVCRDEAPAVNRCVASISPTIAGIGEPCGLGPYGHIFLCQMGLTCKQNDQGTFSQGRCQSPKTTLTPVDQYASEGQSCAYTPCKEELYCNKHDDSNPICKSNKIVLVGKGGKCDGEWSSDQNAGNHLCKLGTACFASGDEAAFGTCVTFDFLGPDVLQILTSPLKAGDGEPCGLGPYGHLYNCEDGLKCMQNDKSTFAQGICRRDSSVHLLAGEGQSCKVNACKEGLYCNHFVPSYPICKTLTDVIVGKGGRCNGEWGSDRNAGNHLCKEGLTCYVTDQYSTWGTCTDEFFDNSPPPRFR